VATEVATEAAIEVATEEGREEATAAAAAVTGNVGLLRTVASAAGMAEADKAVAAAAEVGAGRGKP